MLHHFICNEVLVTCHWRFGGIYIYIYFAGVTMGLFDNCLENSDKHASWNVCSRLDGEKTPILLQKEAIKLT